MIKLGVFVILLSVVLFVGAVAAPQVIMPLGSLYCPSGQTMTSETDTYNSRPGETDTTDSFYCVDANGTQQSDVSSNVTLSLTAIYLVVLFIGVGLTIVGGRRRSSVASAGWRQPMETSANARALRFTSTASSSDPNPADLSFNDMKSGVQNGVIRFGGQEFHVNDLKSGNYQISTTQGGSKTLADTLHQLEDAHTQGLVTDDEYQKLRQDAMAKLV